MHVWLRGHCKRALAGGLCSAGGLGIFGCLHPHIPALPVRWTCVRQPVTTACHIKQHKSVRGRPTSPQGFCKSSHSSTPHCGTRAASCAKCTPAPYAGHHLQRAGHYLVLPLALAIDRGNSHSSSLQEPPPQHTCSAKQTRQSRAAETAQAAPNRGRAAGDHPHLRIRINAPCMRCQNRLCNSGVAA